MKRNGFKVFSFISATIIFCVFAFVTLIAAAAVDEGTDGNNFVIQAMAKIYYIFRFPIHTLFFRFIEGPFFFFVGLLLNCLFYGFLTERIVFIFDRKKSN
ncbi:hypothetical protein [Pedobacter sp. SG908]|nr:hypothetical protein [Pedobacter sp. SG908]